MHPLHIITIKYVFEPRSKLRSFRYFVLLKKHLSSQFQVINIRVPYQNGKKRTLMVRFFASVRWSLTLDYFSNFFEIKIF